MTTLSDFTLTVFRDFFYESQMVYDMK